MDPIVSRTCWKTLEPVHAQVYFAAEAQEEYAALGFDVTANQASGYFPARAAALGAVGAGVVQAAYVTLTPGAFLPEDDRTPEAVARLWDKITDRTGEIVPQSGNEQSMLIFKTMQGG